MVKTLKCFRFTVVQYIQKALSSILLAVEISTNSSVNIFRLIDTIFLCFSPWKFLHNFFFFHTLSDGMLNTYIHVRVNLFYCCKFCFIIHRMSHSCVLKTSAYYYTCKYIIRG